MLHIQCKGCTEADSCSLMYSIPASQSGGTMLQSEFTDWISWLRYCLYFQSHKANCRVKLQIRPQPFLSQHVPFKLLVDMLGYSQCQDRKTKQIKTDSWSKSLEKHLPHLKLCDRLGPSSLPSVCKWSLFHYTECSSPGYVQCLPETHSGCDTYVLKVRAPAVRLIWYTVC